MFKWLRKTLFYILAIPLLFTVLGAASNQLVLWANHDTFPVLINEAKVKKYDAEEGTVTLSDGTVMLDFTHCVMSKRTHLNFLADVIDVGDIMSVGDILLELGGWTGTFAPFIFIFAVVTKLQKQE